MFNDPSEINSIPTNKFKKVDYDVYVKYHKKTGEPKYKYVKL